MGTMIQPHEEHEQAYRRMRPSYTNGPRRHQQKSAQSINRIGKNNKSSFKPLRFVAVSYAVKN